MFSLPKNLRALFGFLRFATLLWLVAWPLVVVINPLVQRQFSLKPLASLGLGEFKFTAHDGPIVVAAPDAAVRAEIIVLHGSGVVNLATLPSSERWWITMNVLFIHLIGAGWSFWLFDRLWRLCRNLERGQVFSLENTKFITHIGWGLIVSTLLGILAGIVFSDVILDPLLEELTVQGGLAEWLKLDNWAIDFQVGVGFGGPIGKLLIGALMLLLAEAFRQGLKLKAENDLTV